jgi:tetratricopeptide (TPR) repeat protein
MPAPESEPAAAAVQLAAELARAGRFDELERCCRGALAAQPAHLELHEYLTVALYGRHRLEEAIAHYRKIVHLDPNPCDTEFDALYLQALLATRASPSPFRRRGRFFSLVTLLGRTLDRAGAIAECGCYRGTSSYLICGTLRRRDASFTGSGYHVFDSFEGLSPPTLDDEVPEDHANAERLREMSRAGAFAASLEKVRRNLGAFPGITYHPGWIPFSFKGVAEARYRFVHLDVDLYDPTYEALEYFAPRLAGGGLIVSDDYGWPGARRAIEEYCAGAGIAFSVTEHQQAVIGPA